MDETPKDNAFSLLAGDNPISVGNDDAEDAENEEDQRRRQQELQSMLANAFDDIGYDEDNSTLNSSYNESHHILLSGGNGDSSKNFDEKYREATFNSLEQLQVLYQVQVREIQRLSKDLVNVREEKEKERNVLMKKNLLLEADVGGLKTSLKQAQELVMEKSKDIEDYLKDIDYLKDQLEGAREGKKVVEEEMKLWKTKSLEVEQKLGLIEKGLYVPVSEKQIRNKYESQISELQGTLEQTQKSLEQTKKDKTILENEIKDLKQTKELLAIEKDEEIHSLYSQLENTERQCHNLTGKIDFLEKEHKNLSTLLNTTRDVDAKTPEHPGTIKILQQELKRSLDDQKSKRDEIIRLEKDLQEHKTQITKLDDQNQSLAKRNDDLSNQIQTLKTEIESLNVKINEDFEKDKEQLEKIESENLVLKKLTDDLEKQLTIIEKTSENAEHEILRNQHSDLQKCLKDTELNAEMWKNRLGKYEELCLELQETCASQKGQLYESHARITELESKLVLKEKRDELLDDLQQKARMFEEYIKSRSDLETHDKETNTEEQAPEVDEEKCTQIALLTNENKSLKEKVVFDRKALNELTDVWNQEISRLNTLAKDLKTELDQKNSMYVKRQESFDNEFAKMTTIITKFAENIKAKDRYIKECQDKDSKRSKEYHAKKDRLKSEFIQRETRMLQEQAQLKREAQKREDELRSQVDSIQRSCSEGLLKIQGRLGSEMKRADDRCRLESKIIDAYYDMLIQQAAAQKPGKKT